MRFSMRLLCCWSIVPFVVSAFVTNAFILQNFDIKLCIPTSGSVSHCCATFFPRPAPLPRSGRQSLVSSWSQKFSCTSSYEKDFLMCLSIQFKGNIVCLLQTKSAERAYKQISSFFLLYPLNYTCNHVLC